MYTDRVLYLRSSTLIKLSNNIEAYYNYIFEIPDNVNLFAYSRASDASQYMLYIVSYSSFDTLKKRGQYDEAIHFTRLLCAYLFLQKNDKDFLIRYYNENVSKLGIEGLYWVYIFIPIFVIVNLVFSFSIGLLYIYLGNDAKIQDFLIVWDILFVLSIFVYIIEAISYINTLVHPRIDSVDAYMSLIPRTWYMAAYRAYALIVIYFKGLIICSGFPPTKLFILLDVVYARLSKLPVYITAFICWFYSPVKLRGGKIALMPDRCDEDFMLKVRSYTISIAILVSVILIFKFSPIVLLIHKIPQYSPS